MLTYLGELLLLHHCPVTLSGHCSMSLLGHPVLSACCCHIACHHVSLITMNDDVNHLSFACHIHPVVTAMGIHLKVLCVTVYSLIIVLTISHQGCPSITLQDSTQ